MHGPGDVQGEPVEVVDEFALFIVDCYAVEGPDGEHPGRLLHDSAFLSRPKGCDKSGLGSRFVLFEALGPCRFAGWAKGGEVYRDPWGLGFEYEYQPGEPMGRPVQTPYIRCMATEETQTGNTYDSVHFNLTDEASPLSSVPGVDTGLSRVLLPGGGEITPSTASSASKDGGKETFVVFDESHIYNTPELRRMYATVTRNLRKRKRIAGTWFLETTTMFAPGEESVAEGTYKLSELIEEGKARSSRLLFDHRWGECENLADEEALRAALADAYGDAMAWNDIDGMVAEFYDPRASTSDSRRYFLNAPTDTADAWLRGYEWAARRVRYAPADLDVDAELPPGHVRALEEFDTVVLGFDGSRKRSDAVTDATALIGCRVSDGHIFELRVWEQPSGPAGDDWQVPVEQVDAEVRDAFERYNVVGFYADPAKWETYVAKWEAEYGSKLQAKATRTNPIEWWMTGGRALQITRALEQFHSAVIDGELTHDGSAALTRHVGNAKRRPHRTGIQIAKDHPESPRKIDAAVAAVLAWQARLDAIAAGVGLDDVPDFVPFRIR